VIVLYIMVHTQKKKKVVPFSYFSIHDEYISICDNNNDTISSNVRWDAHFDTNVDWSNLFKYVWDFIFHNQIKKLLYKICTKASMTSHQVEKFEHSKLCVNCD
jgi:hypothetical protein